MCLHLQEEKPQLKKVSLCTICFYMRTDVFLLQANAGLDLPPPYILSLTSEWSELMQEKDVIGTKSPSIHQVQ